MYAPATNMRGPMMYPRAMASRHGDIVEGAIDADVAHGREAA